MLIDNLSSRLRCLLLLLCCSLAFTASLSSVMAEERPYYMWIDDAGVLNFSQTRPRDRSAEEIVEPPLKFGHRIAQEKKSAYVSAQTKFKQDTRRANCDSGQKSLQKLQRFKTIFFRGEDGFFRQLSEEGKQEKIKEAEITISENCPEAS